MSDLHAILRSTWLLAALRSVAAGIRDSCSGYAGFRLWLLSTRPPRQGNAKTRVDERSTCDFVFYLAFGRAGLCCGRNPGQLFRLRWFPFRPWLLSTGPPRQGNAKMRVDELRSTWVLAALLCRCLNRG